MPAKSKICGKNPPMLNPDPINSDRAVRIEADEGAVRGRRDCAPWRVPLPHRSLPEPVAHGESRCPAENTRSAVSSSRWPEDAAGTEFRAAWRGGGAPSYLPHLAGGPVSARQRATIRALVGSISGVTIPIKLAHSLD